MKKKLLVGLAIGLFLIATTGPVMAVKPEPLPAASYNVELVGFTSVTTPPNVGRFEMTRMCQNEFTGSRMCTTGEVIKTVNIPALPTDTKAWIQPEISGGIDISGVVLGAGHNCHEWSTDISYYGVTIFDSGRIFREICTSILPVACCAPTQ